MNNLTILGTEGTGRRRIFFLKHTTQKAKKKKSNMNPTKNVSEPMCSRRVRGCCSLWCYKNDTCLNIASQIIWSHEGAPNA